MEEISRLEPLRRDTIASVTGRLRSSGDALLAVSVGDIARIALGLAIFVHLAFRALVNLLDSQFVIDTCPTTPTHWQHLTAAALHTGRITRARAVGEFGLGAHGGSKRTHLRTEEQRKQHDDVPRGHHCADECE